MRIWLRLHYSSIILALALTGVQTFIMPRQYYCTNDDPDTPICVQLAGVLFLYGFLSGMILMARRKGKSESILLAISTLTPLVLPFLFILWDVITQPR